MLTTWLCMGTVSPRRFRCISLIDRFRHQRAKKSRHCVVWERSSRCHGDTTAPVTTPKHALQTHVIVLPSRPSGPWNPKWSTGVPRLLPGHSGQLASTTLRTGWSTLFGSATHCMAVAAQEARRAGSNDAKNTATSQPG
ncbi:hypothetical protein PG984_009940 [Apiospora sp. TS-2023a]